MIEKLRNLFPSLLRREEADDIKLKEYTWFQTETNGSFGISPDELSESETKLLQTLFDPVEEADRHLTDLEVEWSNFLFHGKKSERLSKETQTPFRFLFFSLEDPNVDPGSFKEAVHGFFPDPAPVLWENSQEGVIIEYQQEENDLLFYYDIAEVLMSDFYIKLHLAVGSPVDSLSRAAGEYQWLKKWAGIANNYTTSQIIDYRQAVPYLFLDQTDDETSNHIIDMVLKDTREDKDLLKTIETFLASNSNATLAAKELYMHRNSLQYRVDKFIERTGIDVKQFEGALSVYLALGLLKAR